MAIRQDLAKIKKKASLSNMGKHLKERNSAVEVLYSSNGDSDEAGAAKLEHVERKVLDG